MTDFLPAFLLSHFLILLLLNEVACSDYELLGNTTTGHQPGKKYARPFKTSRSTYLGNVSLCECVWVYVYV